MALDIDWVREQFPAFQTEALRGQSFFENAGGSYACAPVIDRLTRFYTERKVQPYGPFEASRLAGDEMDEARARLATWMGVASEQVSFGPSTSQNTYVLAQAVRGWLSEGDEIIVTNQDHEANSGVWRRLAEDGIVVREWKIDGETGHLNIAALQGLITPRTRLLCFPHCSNVVGEINDVAGICALARAHNVRTVVDGVSYAPHGLPNIPALGCDAYLFSAYKTYGPHQGIMVISEAFGAELPNQAHFFNGDALYKRFTPAGPDHAQVAACAGMVDYFEALAAHHDPQDPAPEVSREVMRQHEIAISEPLVAYLSSRNDLRLLGPQNAVSRAPTFALETKANPEALAQALAERGIMAGASDFYAVRPLEAMGVDPARGVLRLSAVHYTSLADIEKLIAALDEALGATQA